MSKLLILITTESSKKLAKNLAKLLLKKKLAACVSIKPIYSIYEWEGNIEESKEFEITIKSKESILEKKLCDFWQIDYILCRESGSYSQKIWERITLGSKIRLFLVKKPKLKYHNTYFFSKYSSLIDHVAKES